MTRPPRTLRFAVGTALLALGGSACTPSDGDSGPNPGPEPLRKSGPNPGPEPDAPPQKAPLPARTSEPPETPPPDDGDCKPPDCHINPGPTDDPKAPETKQAPTKVVPEKKKDKRVNPGPTPDDDPPDTLTL